MAEIEIGPLSKRLTDEEIVELATGLEGLGAPRLPKAATDDPSPVGELDEDVVADFLDRLEVHDCACEIYLPMEFEGRIEVADLRVGSAQHLLDVLEELRDELSIDEEDEVDEDEEDFDDDAVILQAKLRHAFKLFHDGATASLERHLPMLVTALA